MKRNGISNAARRIKAWAASRTPRSRIALLSALILLAFALALAMEKAARPSPALPAEPPTYAEFSDIDGRSEQSAILEAGKRGLLLPYPDGTFRPDDEVTRAQFALALWRLAGEPDVSEKTPFSDISGLSEPFQAAVAWSFQEGYLDGASPGAFAPDDSVTRQAAMNALFQYNGGVVGLEGLLSRVYDEAITDSGDIADWGKEGMYWAIYHEFIVCVPPLNAANPEGRLSRAQAAEIFVKYIDRFQTEPTA